MVVTGASGNVGTSVVRALGAESGVGSILGLCRRLPEAGFDKVEWARADVAETALEPLFSGADAVIHLAWAIQPSRDGEALEATNVRGTQRVLVAAAAAGVGAVIHASSVGAYSPGPSHGSVDESWPTRGIPTSFYSRHKAATETMLSEFAAEHPRIRVAVLRPGLIFKREAASEIGRYFTGPFLPASLLRRGLLPLMPGVGGLRFQAVHSDDVADAYRLALVGDARGAFNIAAPPVLGTATIASVLKAREVSLPAGVLRPLADLTWRMRLQPTPPGWLDLAVQTPVLDTSRAEAELGWSPRRTAVEALEELLGGLREGAGGPTPPLAPRSRLRLREVLTGVGARNP